MMEYVKVTIISLAVLFILLVLLGALSDGKRPRGTYRTDSIGLAAQPVRYSVQTTRPQPVQPSPGVPPSTLCHGTTLENAIEIFMTNLWLIGDSPPPAVWMVDDTSKAKIYAGDNGAIVVINVAPWVQLTNRGGGIYIYEIPEAIPHREYYRIPGLVPVAVLDPHGNRIR
jgi:hypothetical protein